MNPFPGEEDDGGPLMECQECGRKFKQGALEKHMKICKKVFVQKRKQFSSAANRLGELENAGELIKNAKEIEKEAHQAHSTQSKPKDDGKNGKVPEWKKKSLEFRAAMLAAKAASGDGEAQAKAEEIQQELKAAVGSDPDGVAAGMLKCPHCGRTFNKEAGERHIAICQKTFAKSGGGRLVKGGGQSMKGGRAVPSNSGMPSHCPPAAPMASDRGAVRAGGAQQRKPSSHKLRSQGETPPPGRPPLGR